jgi:hypothetical protein
MKALWILSGSLAVIVISALVVKVGRGLYETRPEPIAEQPAKPLPAPAPPSIPQQVEVEIPALTAMNVDFNKRDRSAIDREAKAAADLKRSTEQRFKDRIANDKRVALQEIQELREDIRHGGKPGVIYALALERRQAMQDLSDRLRRLENDFREKYSTAP